MKKFVSAVLAIALVLSGLHTITVFAESEELSLGEYSAQLAELTQTYGIDSIGGVSEDIIDVTEIPLNRLIIKTDDNSKLEDDCGAIAKIEGYNGIHIMQYTSEEATEQAYDYYNELSNVECIEFDFVFRVLEPETEYVEYEYKKDYLSWGSTTASAHQAVSYATYLADDAPEIVVAVIDTGIDADHSFLKDRVVDSGVDLIENDGNPDDDNSHGTHVAGIIVDNTAENVKVSGYKALDSGGYGYYSVTCSAIDLAVKDDVDVINMSLRWFKNKNCYNTFEESIQNAVDNGISVVVAAGNDSFDAVNACPASNNNVITVAATTINNTPAYFSNYGECVDIAAPGSGIKSTILNNAYGQKSGTSMATPFVAAAAAFLKTLNTNYSPETIESIIKENVFVPEDWNTDYGTGILDFSEIVSKYISPYPKITLNSDKKAEIFTEVENAVAYYTTDGSKPIVGVSSVYSEPIDIKGAVSIRAIVYEEGKYPSTAATLKINWKENITIRYKGTKSMLLPPNRKIVSCYSNNEEIVTADKYNQTIYGVSVGEAKVVVNLETGQRVTYNVTVEYEPWQLFIIYFLFGFLWY